MELNNRERSELEYLRGFKKGIEDAMKLIYGEEEIQMEIKKHEDTPTFVPYTKIETKKITPEEMGKIFDDLKNKVLGGK